MVFSLKQAHSLDMNISCWLDIGTLGIDSIIYYSVCYLVSQEKYKKRKGETMQAHFYKTTRYSIQIIQIMDRYGIQYLDCKTGIWNIASHREGKYQFKNMDYLQCLIVLKVYFNAEVRVEA